MYEIDTPYGTYCNSFEKCAQRYTAVLLAAERVKAMKPGETISVSDEIEVYKPAVMKLVTH